MDSLFETITDMPLPGHEIEILIDGESVGDTVTTDEEGSLEVEHTFDEVGHYQIEARFSSIPFYWKSSTKTELEVFPAPGGFPWPYFNNSFSSCPGWNRRLLSRCEHNTFSNSWQS